MQRPAHVHGASGAKGHAARHQEVEKRTKYRNGGFQGYRMVPIVLESYGRLGEAAMQWLNKLSKKAKRASPGAFRASALRELSVTLCRGNAAVFRKGAQLYVNVTGKDRWHGLRQPCADVDACEELVLHGEVEVDT